MESRLCHLAGGIIAQALDALFPRFCVSCKAEGTLWCKVCEDVAPRRPAPSCPFCTAEGSEATCAHCADDVALDGLMAIGAYGDPMLRDAIHHWKYTADPDAWRPIAQWIRRALPRLGSFSSFAISWIPLHPGRKRDRKST